MVTNPAASAALVGRWTSLPGTLAVGVAVNGDVHGYERPRRVACDGVILEEIRAATIMNGPAYDPTNGRIRS